MFLVLALTFVSLQAFLCDAYVITTSSTLWGFPENVADIKSAKALKENLRRNNDDYRDKYFSTSSRLLDQLFKRKVVRDKAPPAYNRRAYDVKPVLEDDYRALTDESQQKDYHPPRKDVGLSSKEDLELKYKDIAPGRYPKYVNKEKAEKQVNENKSEFDMDKERVDKLTNFLEEHKGLVSQFISSKDGVMDVDGQGRTEPMLAAGTGAGGSRKAGADGVGGLALRARESEADAPVSLPNMHMLDMAPAKGIKVEQLRMNNRLCHRHVMIPEGPKYDSKGKVYLAAYEPVHRQEFQNTRPATLMMPRCCNCCRKSVLGCE